MVLIIDAMGPFSIENGKILEKRKNKNGKIS